MRLLPYCCKGQTGIIYIKYIMIECRLADCVLGSKRESLSVAQLRAALVESSSAIRLSGTGVGGLSPHQGPEERWGDLGWRTEERPRTLDAKAWVSNGPELLYAPTVGHGRAVTMTDFAAHRRRQRQRGMGGCCVGKTGRKRGRKKESSLHGTTDDDLRWKRSI